jgi:poly(3-hydroxybutyrate) depolymerase
MLYQIYETQRAFIEPFAGFAQAASKAYSNPGSAWSSSPLSQRMAAGLDLVYRLSKDYEKPEFGLSAVTVGTTEVAIQQRVEIARPFCDLIRFKRFSDDPATLEAMKSQPAVLIVAPLSGHYATLLRDTVKTMLQGHKVYITDWKNARLVPLSEGSFSLDDYVNDVQDFIRHLQGKYGNCHVMSVCQPTVPVLAAVSLMASRGETTPWTMTMMGGPIDARKSPTAVNNLAMNKSYEWFENNVIYRVPDSFPGAGRRVYPGFLQHSGFVAMNPDRHATSHFDYFKDLMKGDDASTEAHRKFYDEYNAVLDMDAPYYLDTIRVVFQDFNLVNGTWDVKSPSGLAERVRPQDIRTTALLSVEGELDDISGSGQTEAVHALCTGVDPLHQRHFEAKGAGHYGIFSGRRWRDMVYPQVQSFIAAHTPAPKAASAVAIPKAAVVAAPAAKRVASAPINRGKPKAAPAKTPTKAPVAAKTTRAVKVPDPAAVGRTVARAVAPRATPAAAPVPAAAKRKAAAKRAAAR